MPKNQGGKGSKKFRAAATAAMAFKGSGKGKQNASQDSQQWKPVVVPPRVSTSAQADDLQNQDPQVVPPVFVTPRMDSSAKSDPQDSGPPSPQKVKKDDEKTQGAQKGDDELEKQKEHARCLSAAALAAAQQKVEVPKVDVETPSAQILKDVGKLADVSKVEQTSKPGSEAEPEEEAMPQTDGSAANTAMRGDSLVMPRSNQEPLVLPQVMRKRDRICACFFRRS